MGDSSSGEKYVLNLSVLFYLMKGMLLFATV